MRPYTITVSGQDFPAQTLPLGRFREFTRTGAITSATVVANVNLYAACSEEDQDKHLANVAAIVAAALGKEPAWVNDNFDRQEAAVALRQVLLESVPDAKEGKEIPPAVSP